MNSIRFKELMGLGKAKGYESKLSYNGWSICQYKGDILMTIGIGSYTAKRATLPSHIRQYRKYQAELVKTMKQLLKDTEMKKQFTETWPPTLASKVFIVCSGRYYDNGGGLNHDQSRLVSAGTTLHTKKNTADKEANRLAEQNPGETFVVFSAVTTFKTKHYPIERTQL